MIILIFLIGLVATDFILKLIGSDAPEPIDL